MAGLRRLLGYFSPASTAPTRKLAGTRNNHQQHHHRQDHHNRPVYYDEVTSPSEFPIFDFSPAQNATSPSRRSNWAAFDLLPADALKHDIPVKGRSVPGVSLKRKANAEHELGASRNGKRAKVIALNDETEDELNGSTFVDLTTEDDDDGDDDEQLKDLHARGHQWQDHDEGDQTLLNVDVEEDDTIVVDPVPSLSSVEQGDDHDDEEQEPAHPEARLIPGSVAHTNLQAQHHDPLPEQLHALPEVQAGQEAASAAADNRPLRIIRQFRRTLNAPHSPLTPSIFISEQSLLDLGWPDDTVCLIQKLHQRGREPILPSHWQMDFEYLPAELFFPVAMVDRLPEDSLPFIRSLGHRPDFHASRALGILFRLPSRARDRVQMDLPPEATLERGIAAYLTWAYADAGIPAPSTADLNPNRTPRRIALTLQDPGVQRMPQLVVTHTCPRTLDSKHLEHAVLKELNTLHQAWRRHLAHLEQCLTDDAVFWDEVEPPTVYAIVISHTNIAIVSYAGTAMRQVGHFDLGVDGLDVWNALALSIVAIHVRNVCSAVFEVYADLLSDEGGIGSGDGGAASHDDNDDPDL